jgi:N-acetylglucosaminyldiphosphoundecaprenol N-acetyl-beta-D-mannosaminyltransferase
MSSSSVHFAGLTFQGPTRAAIAAFPPLTLVVTVNADFIVTAHADPRFARIINENCATFDGQIPFALARRLARPRHAAIEKITGSDLVPELLAEAAKTGRKVFLLGATPDANAAAVRVARDRFGAKVEGFSPPLATYPFPDEWRAQCRARIEAYRPDYIFVALGAPKQEFWMDEERAWLEPLGVRLCIGCGGSLDFLSGRIKRAPGWVQTIGLEGVYRLLAQPQWFRIKRLLRSFLMFKYIFR